MKSLAIILGAAAVAALAGFSLIMLTGDPDPGQVFPRPFQALVVAVVMGAAGLLAGAAVALLRWLWRGFVR